MGKFFNDILMDTNFVRRAPRIKDDIREKYGRLTNTETQGAQVPDDTRDGQATPNADNPISGDGQERAGLACAGDAGEGGSEGRGSGDRESGSVSGRPRKTATRKHRTKQKAGRATT